MARGTTWTYKPKGPPLRTRVEIYCNWPECPNPIVASWRPRSAKVEGQALALHLLLQVPRSEGLAPP